MVLVILVFGKRGWGGIKFDKPSKASVEGEQAAHGEGAVRRDQGNRDDKQ